ncbi:glycosyltransferase [Alginatibacterium sediminis]|uniref:Glycosyltransferase n=1 Tax=Alginatibacterium sediminis TaxID=2164068 RepID=A0A420E895_9ALTE|nr:glycosyltransferase family 4 protein [Alginatibacterium sediminis]RKF14393.1 glycosyltransferase [Alginatibacterium sediminis]
MKIAHIVSSMNVGGAERFVIDLTKEQIKGDEHKVEILSMGSMEDPLLSETGDIPVRCLKQHSFISDVFQLRQTMRKLDVIHIHSTYCVSRVVLAKALLPFSKVRVIYTRHNERVHAGIKWWLTYEAARYLVYRFVFVAQKAQENYVEHYPRLEHKCTTILNGVAPVERLQSLPKVGLRIGHVGRFIPLKSQKTLLQAMSEIKACGSDYYSLHFYGTGPLMADCKAYCGQHLASCEIAFYGHETDRTKIYSSFDVLVVTSSTEGLSLAILEAMASGIPVIASNVGGNPELVTDQFNGYLYEYGDAQELAAKLEILKNMSDADFSEMCNNSKKRYEHSFSMKQCAANYLAVYQA